MNRRDIFPYIKYELSNGVTFLLTPRPDAYTPLSVKAFVETWNPKVRFQFTDDIPDYESTIPVHWYPWIPGKRLPTELVYAAVMLIAKEASTHGVIWMHCDSSSMRAPTFFGHYLAAYHTPETAAYLVFDGKWTDGRQQSSPVEYSNTSMKLDPGMKDLILAWQGGGEKAAYDQIMKVKWAWETEDEKN